MEGLRIPGLRWGYAGTVDLRRDFLVVPVPKIKVGLCQHKRKLTSQAGHPVTIALYTRLLGSIRQDM